MATYPAVRRLLASATLDPETREELLLLLGRVTREEEPRGLPTLPRARSAKRAR